MKEKLTRKEFDVLLSFYNQKELDNKNIKITKRELNIIKNKLQQLNYINGNILTKEGYQTLEEYKVDNAIILAAGMATRFVPVSYEIPKGLIKVKGEPLIERLIIQLRDAGIKEIIVVIGYMMEKFLYLRDKYNVKFVINNEYSIKNTHSSIYAARDYLKNTLILCADNYYPENMFCKYEYDSYYCSIYLPGYGYTERSLITDNNGMVIDTHKPSYNEWIMYGHSYWTNEFSRKFKSILKKYYGRPGIENYYWETVWSENIKECPLYVKKCSPNQILEFDSVKELEQFDKDYIINNMTSIMENICSTLNCNPCDVTNFQAMKGGLNNHSFKFLCKDTWYVYRHPGKNAEGVIDRVKESFSQKCANELGIDTTLVHIDEQRGWKISKYVDVIQEFDFSNIKLVSQLAHHLKKLHDSKIVVGTSFCYFDEADKLIEIIRREDYDSYLNICMQREKMFEIYNKITADKWQVSLCHNDIYEPNLLVSENGVNLIDWEFSGDCDIGYDICKLFACLDPEYETINQYLELYYLRKVTEKEKKHLIGCSAVIYYYWYVWGIYASKNGTNIHDYLLKWYDKMQKFANIFYKLDSQEE